MNWIQISDELEIMQDPVMEVDFGITNPMPMPARGITYKKAEEWSKSHAFRLPTDEEWLLGWRKMNHWGLWEWTSTKQCDDYKLRGGSWYDLPLFDRVAYRIDFEPKDRFDFIGFRCVRGIVI